jgi:translation elongation factor P/translation initiation factor 5A
MATVILMQTDLTYNVTTDDGNSYTVMITEDFYSGHFSMDAFDDNEEIVTDEVKVLEIGNLIEDQRL